MERRPTIKDVARLACVSIGTVSKVMNDVPTVHSAIRKAVLEAVDTLDYRPSPIARSFQKGTTNAIGFVIADLRIASYLGDIPIAQKLAREHGYTLIVADSQLDRNIEKENLDMLIDLRVSGILFRPIFSIAPGAYANLLNLPVVAFTPPNEVFSTVVPDYHDSLRASIDDLFDNGHEKVGMAFLDGAANSGQIEEIATLVCRKGGMVPEIDKVIHESREKCRVQLRAILCSEMRPTALMVGSALLSATLLAAEDAGLEIPRGLSIISIGDSELAQTFVPHVNAIVYDRAIEAELGIRMLSNIIEKREGGSQTVTYLTYYDRRRSVSKAPTGGAIASRRVG
jgi:LacI family transcriptional regulator